MDESELTQVLGEQFRLLGHHMKGSVSLPSALKPLVQENTAVVLVRLDRGRLRLPEFDELDVAKAEIKNLKEKTKEQQTEIQSLTLLLEEQKPKEEPEWKADKDQILTVAESIEKHKDEKPKRKRKRNRRKAEVTE